MFSDVFSCFPMFSDCFPIVLLLFSDCFPMILFKLNWIIYDGSSVVLRMISDDFICFPMFSAVFQCFPTVFQLFSDDVFRLLKSSLSWTKLSMMGSQLFSGWYQMILDVFKCSQQFPIFSDNVFSLLKSSSSWTKLSMMGSQLFSGWYQIISDVFRLFSAVFRCFLTHSLHTTSSHGQTDVGCAVTLEHQEEWG